MSCLCAAFLVPAAAHGAVRRCARSPLERVLARPACGGLPSCSSHLCSRGCPATGDGSHQWHQGLRVLRRLGPPRHRLPQAAGRHQGADAQAAGPVRRARRRLWRGDVVHLLALLLTTRPDLVLALCLCYLPVSLPAACSRLLLHLLHPLLPLPLFSLLAVPCATITLSGQCQSLSWHGIREPGGSKAAKAGKGRLDSRFQPLRLVNITEGKARQGQQLVPGGVLMLWGPDGQGAGTDMRVWNGCHRQGAMPIRRTIRGMHTDQPSPVRWRALVRRRRRHAVHGAF